MRSVSFKSVILLCLLILILDILAFYWLRSITELIGSDWLRNLIHILFWFFTFGLIGSILVLKVRLDRLHPQRKHLLITSLYGLTVSSFIPKLIFVVIISILFFSNHVFASRESLVVIPIIGLVAGFLPFFVIVYAIFRALYRFKVYHSHLSSELLSSDAEKIRIVHISDLHLGSFNFRYHILDRAIEIINKSDPDFIFFTGDLVNNFAWELKGWSKILAKLKSRHGKYSVLGNHDYGNYSSWKNEDLKQKNFESIKYFYKKIGFKLLLNESERVSFNGCDIGVVGVENWGHPPFPQYGDLSEALKGTESTPLKILLSHDPSHWGEEVLGATDIFLTLSGHTHGMQAGVNLKNKQWSPIKYKYKHWAGMHEEKGQFLNVNRGLGWLGFPGRVGMRPEISLIEISRKS